MHKALPPVCFTDHRLSSADFFSVWGRRLRGSRNESKALGCKASKGQS
jgi:hypothetical protein